MSVRAVAVFLAAALPPVLAWLAKVILVPRPFWVVFYDPESIYFYEGLRLVRGRVPVNIDNPATPVQLASAGIAWITGATPAAYERFLGVAHAVCLLLILAAIAILLRTVLRDLATPLQVAAIWGLFVAPQMLERIDVWGPEVFFLPAAALTLGAAWRWERVRTDRALFLFGTAVGLSVAVKFVFVAWAVALLAIAWRRMHIALAGLAAGFFAGTFPIVTRYLEIPPRLLQLSHNRGEQGWVDLLPYQNAWVVWVLAVIALAAWRARTQRILLAFGGIAFVMSYLQALRAPSFRYLFPTAFCVLLVFAISMRHRSPSRAVQIAVLALAAALVVKTGIGDFDSHRARIETSVTMRAAIASHLTPGGVVLYGWRTPSPSMALRVMAYDARDVEVVSKFYPNEGLFDPWRHRVVLPWDATHWDELVMRRDELHHFPEPLGPIKASVGPFVIVQNARR